MSLGALFADERAPIKNENYNKVLDMNEWFGLLNVMDIYFANMGCFSDTLDSRGLMYDFQYGHN